MIDEVDSAEVVVVGEKSPDADLQQLVTFWLFEARGNCFGDLVTAPDGNDLSCLYRAVTDDVTPQAWVIHHSKAVGREGLAMAFGLGVAHDKQCMPAATLHWCA